MNHWNLQPSPQPQRPTGSDWPMAPVTKPAAPASAKPQGAAK